jgi:hypothetical protein
MVCMKPREEKQILSECIEMLVGNGYSIENVICKPLSYFDFEKVSKRIEELKTKFYEN